MIGFFAIISNKAHVDAVERLYDSDFNGKRYRNTTSENQSFFCASRTNGKFENEKIFKSNNHCFVATDGVILNSKEVLEKCDYNNYFEMVTSSYKEESLSALINQFRGGFSGIIYDEKKTCITAFTDHFSTKTVFYYQGEGFIIISSEVKEIVKAIKTIGATLELNLIGAYALLSYGYMLEDHTLVKGIKRLPEGSLLKYVNGKASIERYHEFSFSEKETSLDEAIENVDRLFRKAVNLQYKKNKENGYLDVVPLSAGMDCRMTSFVLRDVSDSPILNFTYSETGEYDEIYPSKMAKEQGNRWIFKSLDNGLDLSNIEESIALSDTLIKYDWPAQLIDFLKIVNTSRWGIVHTGVIGDVILGSFEKTTTDHRKYKIGDGAFSTQLIEKLNQFVELEQKICQKDYEHGMITNRGINGACLGYSRTFRYVAEDLSPFMNVDFADYCFSLPMKYRRNHYLYYEWVKRKYPQAAQFKHNGVRIGGKVSIPYKGKRYRLKSIGDVLVNKVRRDVIKVGYGMNPQQTWLEQNQVLKRNMDDFFTTHIVALDQWQKLQKDTEQLYKNGTAVEKVLALSLIGSVHMLFITGGKEF